MSTIFAIDPSLSCTGFALLRSGKVDHFGTLRLAEDADLPERLIEMFADLCGILDRFSRNSRIDAIVIERPEENRRGGGSWANISPFTLTVYGSSFGAAVIAAHAAAPEAMLLTPCPSTWVGRARIPSSKGDPHKTRRVKAVEYLFPETRGRFDCMTRAGNEADAILLARWGAENLPIERGKRRAIDTGRAGKGA